MCGITGYIGYREAYPIIIQGLQRLEYRGYDSAGVVLYDGKNINLSKTKGKVSDLQIKAALEVSTAGTIGFGHTRWATHGVPNYVNSHPHLSQSENLVIVHNGIIENYDTLKKELITRGYTFQSDTDTEVLINFIEEVQKQEKCKLGKAVQLALNEVVGAYAILVFDKTKPDELVIARLGSPIAIGIGKDNSEFFIASDATPFIEYTKDAIYLEDGEMAIVKIGRDIKIYKIKADERISDLKIQQLELSLEQIEKGGFEHFMLKEIFEQPTAIIDTYRGRLLAHEGVIKLSGLEDHLGRFLNADRIIIVGCGTSWHAGLVAEYLFEDIARIPVEVEYGSEFRYRNPIITEKDIVIAISQSGETADTLAAVKLAKSKGAFVYGICNVVGSSIAREANSGSYTHAGPEIGVASTKAFTTQITLLTLMALKLGKEKGNISTTIYHTYLQELVQIPHKIEQLLQEDKHIIEIANRYHDVANFLYLGRGYNFPVALEGALKLKEISYIHAEGYPAAEMKHGPIALIDKNMPVIVIATKQGYYEKVVSNIQEIKARQGQLICIVSEGDSTVKKMCDFSIEIPNTLEPFTPLLTTIPLQLLAYHIAVLRGCHVDQPRNLAKSVTVE